MSEEEVIKYPKNIKDKDLWIRGYVYGKKAIDTALQLLEQKNNKINKLKNKMIGDKMEQFDDYVIYLIKSYLEIMGE